ncbi:MAG TPA: hypothetical protein VMA75_00715 [Candidatus Paceibacterota bacterium]|nr:hypothetical protein [Candidatus Paceibacterota bacterium]
MKRYAYIIIGIIVAAAIAIFVLFLIKNGSAGPSSGALGAANTTGSLPAANTQTGGGTSGGSTGEPGEGAGALTLTTQTGSSTAAATSAVGNQMSVQAFGVLSSDSVLDYFVAPNNVITAIEPTGEIISIVNGQSMTVSTSTISDIISASFSYDGKKIMVSYGDPTDPQAGVFDVSSSVWTLLPQGIQSPQWSPGGNYQIAYFVTTASGKLALATIDASNIKKGATTLLTLNANDLSLQWPTVNEFVFADKPSYESDGSIWTFNRQAGTLAPLIYEEAGAEGIWSHNAAIPYGLIFVSGSTSAGGGNLELKAISGSLQAQQLAFSTLPSKCAFDTEQMPATASSSASAATSTPYLALYCGIPRSSSGFSSAHLPDDYDMMALFTSDDIYKVNTATGAEQVLWNDPTQNMDISDVKFANNALFFVNRYDQKLYGLTFSSH